MSLVLRWLLIATVALLTLLIAACISAPVRWWLKESPPLRVQVIDKSVPHTDYREHAALYWILRHEKVYAVDGSVDWPLAEDYRGFHPTPEDPRSFGNGDLIDDGDLVGADLLYLADAYGVYEDDFDEPGRAALDASPLVYGGMATEEVASIERFVEQGGALVAEFNAFASPTGSEARARMERLMGVRWTGWSGRYFLDLSDENEVPRWAPRLWREQRQMDWEFTGPGYLLVHEDTRLLVLREPQELTRPSLVLTPTPHDLVADTLDATRFAYWFDIVAASPASTVAASFELVPTESGEAMLREAGVPTRFPAVVVASRNPLRVYFAGDFADAATGLGPHWAEGMPWMNRLLVGLWFPRDLDQEPFYWGFYIPMMRSLLAELAD